MNGFELTNAQGKARKISNNLLNFGEDKVTAFTIPIEGIPLSAEQLDALMGQYTFRSWYNQKPDGSWHPMDWWAFAPKCRFKVEREVICHSLRMELSGREIDFQTEEPDEDDDDAKPLYAGKITNIMLEPKAGGVTLMSCHLQVRPGLDMVNLILQEHQFHNVTLSWRDLVNVQTEQEAAEKAKQGELPLARAGDTPSSYTSSSSSLAAPLDVAGEGPLVWWQHGMTGDQNNGYRSQMPPGCVEIDPPADGVSEAEQLAADAEARGDTDTADFAEGVGRALGAHVQSNGVLDGRSERVKHQDSQGAEAA